MSDIVLTKMPNPPTSVGVGESSISISSLTGDAQITDGDSGITKTFKSVYGSNLVTLNEFYTGTSSSSSFSTYSGTTYSAGLGVSGQKYKISFCLLQRYSSLGRNFICRVAIDGSTLEQEISFENKDSGSDIRVPIYYFYIIDGSQLNNAGGFLDVDYRCQQDGDTATIYSCSLEFIRIK